MTKMAKVRLGEVARECKSTVKDTTGLPVVGLEHLIPGQIELTQWSENADNTFTKGFKKGQVLFGRRRAYLKKAAVAPFDGICSGDITVIEALPDRILPELLPFIIQNDSLFDYAVEKSAGSLSPRVKWEHLKNYVFELPNLEHQQKLVDLLWAMMRTKKAYQKLANKTDELVKSQFIEMFGEPFDSPKWPIRPIRDVAISMADGSNVLTSLYKASGAVVFLRIQNVWRNEIRFDDTVYITDEDNVQYSSSSLKKGDVLISKIGRINTKDSSLGRVALYLGEDDKANYSNNILRIRFRTEVNPRFANAMMNLDKYNLFIRNSCQGSTDKRALSKTLIGEYPMMIPPLALQDEYAAFVEQSDKSKFELKQAISRIDEMIKALMKA